MEKRNPLPDSKEPKEPLKLENIDDMPLYEMKDGKITMNGRPVTMEMMMLHNEKLRRELLVEREKTMMWSQKEREQWDRLKKMEGTMEIVTMEFQRQRGRSRLVMASLLLLVLLAGLVSFYLYLRHLKQVELRSEAETARAMEENRRKDAESKIAQIQQEQKQMLLDFNKRQSDEKEKIESKMQGKWDEEKKRLAEEIEKKQKLLLETSKNELVYQEQLKRLEKEKEEQMRLAEEKLKAQKEQEYSRIREQLKDEFKKQSERLEEELKKARSQTALATTSPPDSKDDKNLKDDKTLKDEATLKDLQKSIDGLSKQTERLQKGIEQLKTTPSPNVSSTTKPVFIPSTELPAPQIVEKHIELYGVTSVYSEIYAEHRGSTTDELQLDCYETMTSDETRKILLKVKRPSRLRGAGLLLIQYKDRKGDCWKFDPQYKGGDEKKVLRVPMMEWKDNIFGTDFTYEDLVFETPYFYEYTRMKDIYHKGIPCYIVKATPKDQEVQSASAYSRKYYWFQTDNYQPVQVKLFDKNGEGNLVKVVRIDESVELSKGVWRPVKIELFDINKRTYTTLQYTNMQVKKELPDDIFSIKELTKETGE